MNAAQSVLKTPTNPKGAGRPPGQVNSRTRAIRELADKAIGEGVLPLEVMLTNMRFYHAEAGKMLAKILNFKEPSTLLAIEALKELCDFRDKAQSCAVDAAPFIHPRLSAVAVKAESSMTLTVSDGSLNKQQAIEDYAKAIDSPLPMKLIEQIAVMESTKPDVAES